MPTATYQRADHVSLQFADSDLGNYIRLFATVNRKQRETGHPHYVVATAVLILIVFACLVIVTGAAAQGGRPPAPVTSSSGRSSKAIFSLFISIPKNQFRGGRNATSAETCNACFLLAAFSGMANAQGGKKANSGLSSAVPGFWHR